MIVENLTLENRGGGLFNIRAIGGDVVESEHQGRRGKGLFSVETIKHLRATRLQKFFVASCLPIVFLVSA